MKNLFKHFFQRNHFIYVATTLFLFTANLVSSQEKGRVNTMIDDSKGKVLSTYERELLLLGNTWTIYFPENKDKPIDTFKLTRRPNTNIFDSQYYNKRNGIWVAQTNPLVTWQIISWDKVSNKVVIRTGNTMYTGTYIPAERRIINGTNSLDQPWVASIY